MTLALEFGKSLRLEPGEEMEVWKFGRLEDRKFGR